MHIKTHSCFLLKEEIYNTGMEVAFTASIAV